MRLASRLLGLGAAAVLAAACGGRVVIDPQGFGGGGAGGSGTTTSSSASSSTTTTSSSGSGGAGGSLVQLAKFDHPYAVTLDADYVYVSVHGEDRVVKLPKAGGPPIAVGSVPSPGIMTIDDTRVYVQEGGVQGLVHALPKTGGDGKQLGSSLEVCGALVADATRVYCSYPGATIRAFDKNDGTVTTLGSTVGSPRGLVVDDAWIYWAADENASVGEMPKGGGASSILSTTSQGSGAWNMASDGTRLYWLVGLPSSGELRSMDKAGGPATVLTTVPPIGLLSVAVDDAHVYWTNNVGGTVSTISKGGGPVTVLAAGQGTVFGIAADATGVYWASNTTGQVMRFTW